MLNSINYDEIDSLYGVEDLTFQPKERINKTAINNIQNVPEEMQNQYSEVYAMPNWFEGLQIYSPEEEAEIRAKGGISIGEVWQRHHKGQAFLPYVNTTRDTAESINVMVLLDRVKKGQELDDKQMDVLVDYLRNVKEEQLRGYSFGSGVVNATLTSIPYLEEFAIGLATAPEGIGFASLAKTISTIGAKKSAKKAVQNAMQEALVKSTMTGVKKNLTKQEIKKIYDDAILKSTTAKAISEVGAKEFAKQTIKATPKAVGTSAKFAMTKLPHHFAGNIADRQIATGIYVTDAGQGIFQDSENVALSTMKALGDTTLEALTETTGFMFLPISRFFAKPVRTLLPKKFFSEFDKLVSSRYGMKATEALRKYGYDGVLEEMGEEQLNRFLTNVFGSNGVKGYTIDGFLKNVLYFDREGKEGLDGVKTGFENMTEGYATEAASFSLVGGGARGIASGTSRIQEQWEKYKRNKTYEKFANYSLDEFYLDQGLIKIKGSKSSTEVALREKLEKLGADETTINNYIELSSENEMRMKLNELIANEINQIDNEQFKLEVEQRQKIADELYKQAKKSGVSDAEAQSTADLYSVAFQNLAKQTGEKIENIMPNIKIESISTEEALDKYGKKEVQTQFAGEKSETANKYSLEEAKKQLANGFDFETVRQNTGWFKGVDGKFRYEISDNEAELNNLFEKAINAENVYRTNENKENELYKIKEKFYNQKKDLDKKLSELYKVIDTESELLNDNQLKAQKEIEKLQKEYTNVEKEYEKVNQEIQNLREETNEALKDTSFLKVGDVLKHDKLYAAYPEIKSIDLSFRKLDGKTQGYYSDYEIVIDSSVSKDRALEILMHEIQHYIQDKENFARGGSPETIKRLFSRVIDKIENSKDLIEYEKLMKEYSIMNDALLIHSIDNKPENITKSYWWIQKGKGWYAPKKTSKKARKEYIDACCEELRSYLLEKNKQRDTDLEYSEYLQLDTKKLRSKASYTQKKAWNKLKNVDIKTKEKFKDALKKVDNFEVNNEYLYFRLAGEVEARATEKRLDLTEEQRYSSTYNPYNTSLFGYDIAPEEQFIVFSDGTSVPYSNSINSNIQNQLGYSVPELEEMFKYDIENIIEENYIDESEFKLEDIRLYGSYSTGKNKQGSDLDFLVQYSGTLKEDAVFNILNEKGLTLTDLNGNKINIDFNPIKDQTIDEYLEYNRKTYFQSASSAGANENEIAEAEKEYAEKGTESKYFKRWTDDAPFVPTEQAKSYNFKTGEKVVVKAYHGTNQNIIEFDYSKRGSSTNAKSAKAGFWFVDNKITADSYADFASTEQPINELQKELDRAERRQDWKRFDELTEQIEKIQFELLNKNPNERGAKTFDVYVKFENPYVFDAKNNTFMDIQAKINNVIQEAQNNNYDGLIIKNLKDKPITGEYGEQTSDTHYLAFKNTQIKSVDNRGTFDANNPNIYFQASTNPKDDILQRTDKSKYLTDNEVEQLKKDKENFENYVQKLINGELSYRTQLRVVEKLPSAYNKIPQLKGKKVVITQDVYRKIIDLPNKFNKNHFIDRTRAIRLPEFLSDPLYILQSISEGNEHRFVVVTASKNKTTSEKLSIILEPKSNAAIVSAYDEEINISEEKKNKRVLYNKKEELSKTILASKTRAIDNSNNIITDNNSTFNPRFQLSEQRNLIMAHASKSANLDDILKNGTLVAPSFSITPKDSDVLEDGRFGDVLFVRKPQKIDFKNDNIYDRDFYSPRMPKPYFDIPDGRVVDFYEYDSLKRQYESNPEKFVEKWGKTFDEYFKGAKKVLYLGMTNSGNRRYVPYNAENIIKEMNKKGLLNKEGFDYGLSSLLARFSTKQNTKEQLKETAKENLGKKSQLLEEEWKKIKKEYDDLGDKVAEYYYDKWSFYEVQSDAFYAISKNMKKTINEIFSKELPKELIQEIKEFVDKARKLPRSYFEAKPMREVELNEISHAFVKENVLNEKQIEKLKEKGIKVVIYKNGELNKKLQEEDSTTNIYFQSAFHGGKVDFDRFDLSYALTGEGAMAHGYGLYFAENKIIADEHYRKRLVGNNVKWLYDGQEIKQDKEVYIRAKAMGKEALINSYEEQIKRIEEEAKTAKIDEELEKILGVYTPDLTGIQIDNFKKKIEIAKNLDVDKIEKIEEQGQLYEVDIPENDVLLDEDKTYNEQPKEVQKALSALAYKEKMPYQLFVGTGKDIYNNIREWQKDAWEPNKNVSKEASLLLNKYGIKGITYDGRQDGRCYVIFDDKAVDIINRFYQEDEIEDSNINDTNASIKYAKGFTFERQLFDGTPKESVVVLIKNKADASTLVHEFGHIYLQTLTNLARTNTKAKDLLLKVNKWLRYDGKEYTVAQHEKFAQYFTAYVRSGKAPSYSLKRVFENFKNWLNDIYNYLNWSDEVELDAEAENLFRELLGERSVKAQNELSEKLIEEARQNALLRLDEAMREKGNIRPNQLTDKQRRYRDTAYDIIFYALKNSKNKETRNYVTNINQLKMILGSKSTDKKGRGLAKQHERIALLLAETDDAFSANDGFLPEWGEFFPFYSFDEVGADAELAMEALSVIMDKKYLLDPDVDMIEQEIKRSELEFEYLLESYKNSNDKTIETVAFYDWLENNAHPYLEEDFAKRWENETNEWERYNSLTEFEKAKEDLLVYAAKMQGQGDYSWQFAEYARAIIKRLDFMAERDKSRIFDKLKSLNSFKEIKENLDDIMDFANTLYEVNERRKLADDVIREVKQTIHEWKDGIKRTKYTYPANKLFERLRQLNKLPLEDIKDLYDAIVNEEIAPTYESDKVNDEDYYKTIEKMFIEFKANGLYYNSTAFVQELLTRIQTAKFTAKIARDEIDFERRMQQINLVDELAKSVGKHKGKTSKLEKAYRFAFNLNGALEMMFDKNIKEKFSLDYLYATKDAKVGADRNEVLGKLKDIFGYKGAFADTQLFNKFIDMNKPEFKIKQRYTPDIELGLIRETHTDKETGKTFTDRVIDIGKGLPRSEWEAEEIELSRMQVLYYYILSKNEESYKILTDMGDETTPAKGQFDKYEFDTLIAQLTPQEQLMGDILQLASEKYYPELNKYHIEKYHTELGKVKNYFPRKTDMTEVKPLELFNDYVQYSGVISAQKQRTAGLGSRIKPANALAVLFEHIEKSNTLIIMGKQLDLMNRVFKEPNLKRKIENVWGFETAQELYNLITGNLYSGQTSMLSEAESIIGTLSNNVIKAQIFAKAQVGLKQVMSFMNYGVGDDYVSTAEWSKEFFKQSFTLKDWKKNIDYMMSIPYLKDRFGRGGSTDALKRQLEQKMFAKISLLDDYFSLPIKLGDMGAIILGGKPYIDVLRNKGYTEEQAIKIFIEKTVNEQQSSIPSTFSNIQRNAARQPLAKMFFAYQNTPWQYFRVACNSIIQFKQNPSQYTGLKMIKLVGLYMYVFPLLFNLASSLSPLGGDEDEIKLDLWKSVIGGVTFIPIAGMFINTIMTGILGERVSTGNWFDTAAVKTGNLARKAAKGDDITLVDMWKAIALFGEVATGLPLTTLGTEASGVYDVATGKPIKGAIKIGGYSDYRAKTVTGEK